MFIIPTHILKFLNNLNLNCEKIVVGVSGGADSIYLTHLLNEWCKKNKKNLIAATVDHALRPESRQEAAHVHKELSKQKIRHEILTWEGIKPKTNIEEKARNKRYELLINFCKNENASTLFLAHHQQDQSETFLSRLAHASGLDGLCAMSPITDRNGIMLIRPLLTTNKSDIITTLKAHKISWIEDPMNQDPTYERVRWRQKQNELQLIGLTSEHITKSTQRLKRAKDALDFYAQNFLNQFVNFSALGYITINEKTFKTQPEEIRIRVATLLFKLLTPKQKQISLDSIEKIALTCPKHATLAGCQWVISRQKIYLALEEKELKQNTHISANHWVKWGSLLIKSDIDFIAKSKAPSPRLKGVPYLIQRTFLHIPSEYQLPIKHNNEKELEKKSKISYKDKTRTIQIKFDKQKEKNK